MLLLLHTLLIAVLLLHAPDGLWRAEGIGFFFLLGVIGAWRYSWYGVHLVRSWLYRALIYPQRRAYALAQQGNTKAAHVYCLLTAYRVPPATAVMAMRALLHELIAYDQPATVVASIVEGADERAFKRVFALLDPPAHIRLTFVRQPGRGKRTGLVAGLRAIQRDRPPPGAVVMLMDGDNLVPRGTLARCVPFFRAYPRVLALTTDEDCRVIGGPVMRRWHRLRFAQRHLMMSSLALSWRVLCLTGRMSLYRAEVACDPSFIAIIREDTIEHWRLGRFRLLTGDDKSAWYWVMARAGHMLYVPDVRTLTIEHPPADNFFAASTKLMLRWSGNMLRGNRRALALGPAQLGWFTWWCLIDQRISMWTPLIAPTLALLALLAGNTLFLYALLVWILLTRLVLAVSLYTVRTRISGLWPALIYYNQVFGALVKIYVWFRLDRQHWTRQNIASHGPTRPVWRAVEAWSLQSLALAAFVVVLAYYTGWFDLGAVLRRL